MTLHSILTTAATPVVVAVFAIGSAKAQVVESETVLIRSLDRAFKPSLLSTAGGSKDADGTYTRHVTTGDAIAKPTFAKPLETARTACAEAGGVLTLAMSAGRYDGIVPRTVIQLGDQRLDVSYSSLYRLFTGFESAMFDAGSVGFKPMFRTSPFAERAAKQADAAPPFGLFQCTSSTGAGLWAIAIMPVGMPRGYDVPIRVTPITQGWIKARQMQLSQRVEADQRARDSADRQRHNEDDRIRAEAVRLRPFRAGLKIGSRTNCGIVIAVRDALVQVQLPPHISGPSGTREFWVPREELTDGIPPRGCGFGV